MRRRKNIPKQVYFRRWWRIPPSRLQRDTAEEALVLATELNDEYGQVVDVDRLVVELLNRGWVLTE